MKKLSILTAIFLLLSGCVAKTSITWDRAVGNVNPTVLNIPFFPQKEYNCGPASLAMLLAYSGSDVLPDSLVSQVYTPSKKGSLQPDMIQGVRRSGRIPYVIKSPEELFSMLKEGRPVLVLLNLGLKMYPKWHYAVVTGINPQERIVFLHSGETKNEIFSYATFEHTWKRSGYWGFVALKTGEIPENADMFRFLDSVSAYEIQDMKGALKSYEAAYAKWQGDRNVMFAYADGLYNADEKELSIQMFKRIYEQYPSDADAVNNLAHILNETGNKEEALVYAERAVALGGRNIADYRETLDSIKNP